MRRRIFATSVRGMLAAALLAGLASTTGLATGRLNVFAAASLKTALDDIAIAWKAETTGDVAISYAASSALARQIAQGAPADVFISADLDWMDVLSRDGIIAERSVVKLVGNAIVLVAPADSAVDVKIAKGFDLAGALDGGRLAIGDVKAVPAGKYARAALESLGVWPAVEGKVAMAENARAALKLVSTGEAALGIVYTTDAQAEAGVKVLGTFPASTHPAIIYPAGLVAASTHPDAQAFLAYLQGARAQTIFRQQGFTVLVAAAK